MGLTLADFEGDDVELWPEHLPAYDAFVRMGTQWRAAGMGGVIGLDYSVLFQILDLLDLGGQHRNDVFDDVRVMEREALAVMAEQTDRKR